MFGDYVPTDKELSTMISWGASVQNLGEMDSASAELFKKLLTLKDTREKNSKAWAAFSKELEY